MRANILIRAQEPEDSEAIAEISMCPSVVAGTLQLPLRSLAERRADAEHRENIRTADTPFARWRGVLPALVHNQATSWGIAK
jgi:hypothetical protein